MIYFVRANGTGLVKIGFTAGDVSARIAALQTGCPYKLELEHQVEGDLSTERKFHELHASRRESGEWFRLSRDEVIQSISRVYHKLPSIADYERVKLSDVWAYAVHDHGLHRLNPGDAVTLDDVVAIQNLITLLIEHRIRKAEQANDLHTLLRMNIGWCPACRDASLDVDSETLLCGACGWRGGAIEFRRSLIRRVV